jgi:HD-like signal output (HDOD) protein
MSTLISTLSGGRAEFFSILWKRMGELGDFPSLSKTVKQLSETMHDEEKNISDVTAAILSDFTLTQKVIRLANSAMYAGLGGEITTVTKAAVVLGLDAISHLALSVRFVDKLSSNSPDTATAHNEMAKALIAGDIARNIATRANLQDGEESVVCALMHHLGRLLLAFYFPEEWAKIQNRIAGGASENQATQEVIGITLDDISQEAALMWRLPRKISNSMGALPSTSAISIPGSPEWLKTMASFADEASAVIFEKNASSAELKRLVSRYNDALLISEESILSSVGAAANTMDDLIMLESVERPHGKPADARDRLAAGVLETTRALEAGMNFGNALNLVLETMYAGMGFNRVAAFLRDGDTFKGRVGFGTLMPEALASLAFPETYAADVFHVSLLNKADIFIEDAASPKSAPSIPAWFTAALPDVRAFVLLPMIINNRPVGLLYGDWHMDTTSRIEKNELMLLRSLRDHLMQVLQQKK